MEFQPFWKTCMLSWHGMATVYWDILATPAAIYVERNKLAGHRVNDNIISF
jgi:hypothetical protein